MSSHTGIKQLMTCRSAEFVADCAVSHANGYQSGAYPKHVNTCGSYSVSELRDCFTACYLLNTDGTINTEKTGHHHSTDSEFGG